MTYIRKDIDIHPKQGCSEIITCKVTGTMKQELFDLVGEGHMSVFIRQALNRELTKLKKRAGDGRKRKTK